MSLGCGSSCERSGHIGARADMGTLHAWQHIVVQCMVTYLIVSCTCTQEALCIQTSLALSVNLSTALG